MISLIFEIFSSIVLYGLVICMSLKPKATEIK